jgi:hypothetical protein
VIADLTAGTAAWRGLVAVTVQPVRGTRQEGSGVERTVKVIRLLPDMTPLGRDPSKTDT